MRPAATDTVSRLLDEVNGGHSGAFDELVAAVYAELRKIAHGQMRRKFNRDALNGLTCQPTEMVHEAIVRLADQAVEYRNRNQFYAIATKLIIRQIQDYQRRRLSEKRGGGDRGLPLEAGAELSGGTAPSKELEFTEVIQELERESPRAAEVAVLRLVADHTMPEIAGLLAISLATAERDWRFAVAHLKNAYGDEE